MALTIYPATDYDSFVSLVDANSYITDNSLQSAQWTALTDAEKEVYLRIATTRILNAVSTDSTNTDGYLDETTYVAAESCLPKSCSLMAMHDLAHGLSSEINPNLGSITKEKIGDLEVEYKQNNGSRGRKVNPFPSSVIPCLNSYGANVTSGSFLKQVTLEHS